MDIEEALNAMAFHGDPKTPLGVEKTELLVEDLFLSETIRDEDLCKFLSQINRPIAWSSKAVLAMWKRFT